MEARIAALAKRLDLTEPDAHERVLSRAIDALDAEVPPLRQKMTPEKIAAEYKMLSAAGRRWREENPAECDGDRLPSKTWQEALYDEQGLPK